MQDYQEHPVRSSLILTDTYVPGTIIDGLNGRGVHMDDTLILLVDWTKGSLTSLELKIEFAPYIYYNLAYDNQTANFTVGKTVTGADSGAQAVIISDTDSGASGTLVIAMPAKTKKGGSNLFFNNELITDDNGTPGSALVNDASFSLTGDISDYGWYQGTKGAVSAGVETLTLHSFTTTVATSKFRTDPISIKDRFIRVSSKGTGTVTNSLLAITAITGQRGS